MTRGKIIIAAICFAVFISGNLFAGNLLDEFSSIYHSDIIIEVAVSVDDHGHPLDSYYTKRIKGSKKDVAEALQFFGIKKKKGKIDAEQKRLMFFYRNGSGKFRNMNLIRQGVGPYSDEIDYVAFKKMVSAVSKKVDGQKDHNGILDLENNSLCFSLKKNKYFLKRYGHAMKGDKFIVGADAGIFKKFSPLVRIKCE